ncbi:MAG: NUDIX domain-containing protein [Pseudomonadota bacterium]|nr:NUDIX domain-containing protein [Pseudomonadota bacterium]
MPRDRNPPDGKPADLRPAATVILLRDTPDGPEVWMMERNRAVGFMGAAWVFPGGRVDPEDATRAVRLTREDGIPSHFRAAAARELEEEAGVRLGDAEAYHLDGLVPWSHWITPEIEPRRYDTWFFVAALPSGAEARIDGQEAVAGAWLRPADALTRAEAGTLPLAPPTLRTLVELLPYADVAAALAARRPLPPICPRFVKIDDLSSADASVWVLLPGDPDYPSDEPVDPPTRFPFAVGRWWAR